MKNGKRPRTLSRFTVTNASTLSGVFLNIRRTAPVIYYATELYEVAPVLGQENFSKSSYWLERISAVSSHFCEQWTCLLLRGNRRVKRGDF